MPGIDDTSGKDGLKARLAALPALDRKGLVEQFRSVYSKDPPPYLSQPILTLAIAYRIQEQALGGLKPAIRRRLLQAGADLQNEASPTTVLRPGATLVREWQGVTHTISVIDKGFVYQARTYRSLTEVARTITGTHQSGPIFFGLRKRRANG